MARSESSSRGVDVAQTGCYTQFGSQKPDVHEETTVATRGHTNQFARKGRRDVVDGPRVLALVSMSRNKAAAKVAAVLAAIVAIAALAWSLGAGGQTVAQTPPDARVAPPQVDAMACLGRILPEDGVVRLSARSLSGQPSIVQSLLVKEGDTVRAGQVVALLDSRPQLEAAWRHAEARIQVARDRATQVRAGARAGDLQAVRADMARLDVELADAQRDEARYRQLFADNVVSRAELDGRLLRTASTVQMLEQAKARLAGMAEVRDVDVAVAEAELKAAVAAAAAARAEFDHASIRAPADGQVIAIHAWPGEDVGEAGLLELARTDKMYAVAEVDEADIRHVRVGQRATVTGAALATPLTGVVEFVATRVARNGEASLDPIAPTDARVVQARVRLDDPAAAARFVNAQVTVLIAR
jgi:HlyD family secretion protein